MGGADCDIPRELSKSTNVSIRQLMVPAMMAVLLMALEGVGAVAAATHPCGGCGRSAVARG